jgi:hypothetical protein
MWAILESVLRAAVSVAPFLERWLKKQPTPDPIETVRVVGDMALIDIENRGLAAEFTAQIVKVVNVEGWPHKTVWVRWDHDKDARSMRIARKTSAQIRVATKFDRPKRGLKWACHFGTDFETGQYRMARSQGQVDWVGEVHIQLMSDPEFEGGPSLLIVFLRADGTVRLLTKTKP